MTGDKKLRPGNLISIRECRRCLRILLRMMGTSSARLRGSAVKILPGQAESTMSSCCTGFSTDELPLTKSRRTPCTNDGQLPSKPTAIYCNQRTYVRLPSKKAINSSIWQHTDAAFRLMVKVAELRASSVIHSQSQARLTLRAEARKCPQTFT